MSNRCIFRVVIAAVLAILACAKAQAASSKPILIELFTSEGCSSCPPADAFLRALDTQPVPGAELIVLEEHVDYWDQDGWQDPFSSHEFTQRQSDYVESLRLKSGPYTPQMVIDGKQAFVGSNRLQASRALETALADPKINVELSSPKIENGKVQVHVAVASAPAKAEVFVALALDHAQSQVLRGENGGQRLEHVAVLRHLSGIGKMKDGETFSKEVSIPLPHSGETYRLIAFVQEPKQGQIIGAALAKVE